MTRLLSPSKMMRQTETNQDFIALCLRIDEYVQNQLFRDRMGQTIDESLERTPDSGLSMRHLLPPGLLIQVSGISREKKTTHLQICFDPNRFRRWLESMGTMSLVFLNPHGIEVVLDPATQTWKFFVDDYPLPADIHSEGLHELARFEVRDNDQGSRSVFHTGKEQKDDALQKRQRDPALELPQTTSQ